MLKPFDHVEDKRSSQAQPRDNLSLSLFNSKAEIEQPKDRSAALSIAAVSGGQNLGDLVLHDRAFEEIRIERGP